MRFITAVLLMISAAGPLGAQSIPEQNSPRIRVKSAFAGPVWRVGADMSETFFAASSSYSSVTLWPAAAPERELVFRAPLRDEQRKKAAPLAISPDGELLAYGVPPRVTKKAKFFRIRAISTYFGAAVGRLSGRSARPPTRSIAVRRPCNFRPTANILRPS